MKRVVPTCQVNMIFFHEGHLRSLLEIPFLISLVFLWHKKMVLLTALQSWVTIRAG